MKTVLYFYESAFMMWRRRLAGIYAVARNEKWHVEAIDVGELNDGIKSVLKYWAPDGVIVEGGVFRHRGCEPSAFSNLTAVYCDADSSRIGNDYFGVKQNSKELIIKSIHELLARNMADYAFVHYRTLREWTTEREEVFRKEMISRGKNIHVFRSWERHNTENGTMFGSRLVNFIASLPRPCGILAANDEMAVHILRAAKKAGIIVPDDMTVMGIDNDELICNNTSPSLSSVAPAFERSGRLAAGLLTRRFKQPYMAPVIVDYGADPIERRLSTRKASRTDTRIIRAIEYIRLNACKGISVTDVVGEMGLTARTAENRFHEITGHSIRDEIISVRVSKAKQLLSNPYIAVNSIYAQCGYRNERSLRWVFTKATGLSPAAWRIRHAAKRQSP